MNNTDVEYRNLLSKVLNDKIGVEKDDRTGVGTMSVFAVDTRYDISDGKMPLLQGKRVAVKSMIAELLWFISGDTSLHRLLNGELGTKCKIWTDWCYKHFCENGANVDNLSQKEFEDKCKNDKAFSFERGNIGNGYGKQWRNGSIDGALRPLRDVNGKYISFDNQTLNSDAWLIVPKSHDVTVFVDNHTECEFESEDVKNRLLEIWTDLQDLPTKPLNLWVCEDWYSFKHFYQDVQSTTNYWHFIRNPKGFELVVKSKANFYSKGVCAFVKTDDLFSLNTHVLPSDPLQDVIYQLENNPHGRRIVLDTWNHEEIMYMMLPTCHYSYQFFLDNQNRLSCKMVMRSNDIFLGMPFNIASGALLTHIIAKICGFETKELILSVGDAHVYKNHFDAVTTYLGRNTDRKVEPTITWNRDVYGTNIDEISFKDFSIKDYKPHPAIKADVAV